MVRVSHRSGQLRTDRLLLRRPHKTDLVHVVVIYCDPRANPYSLTGPVSAEGAKSILRGFICHWWRYGFGYWAIELLSNGEVVGFGGLSHGVESSGGEQCRIHLNLYYQLRPSAWGHGYAVEMAQCAVDWAARVTPEAVMTISTRPENLPAVRVAERLGFAWYQTIEKNGVEYSQFCAIS